MSVRVEEDGIVLEGRCPAGDAETLLLALRDHPEWAVDISGVQKTHLAVLQILLALRPRLRGSVANPFLARNIFERLISNSDKGSEFS